RLTGRSAEYRRGARCLPHPGLGHRARRRGLFSYADAARVPGRDGAASPPRIFRALHGRRHHSRAAALADFTGISRPGGRVAGRSAHESPAVSRAVAGTLEFTADPRGMRTGPPRSWPRRAHGCGGLMAAARYFRKTAVSVTSGTAANALDSGQSCFAPAASFWNVASSMPGTLACKLRTMRSI